MSFSFEIGTDTFRALIKYFMNSNLCFSCSSLLTFGEEIQSCALKYCIFKRVISFSIHFEHFYKVSPRQQTIYVSYFLLLKILFFIFRERKGGRETSMCGSRLECPYWGPGPQPRRVPWQDIKLVILWFSGWRSIHWATPTRALCFL